MNFIFSIFKNDFGKLVLWIWIVPFFVFLILSIISSISDCPIAWEHTKGACKSIFVNSLPTFYILLYLMVMAIPSISFFVVAIMRASKKIEKIK